MCRLTYWKKYKLTTNAINRAAKAKNTEEKRKILSELRDIPSYLYKIIRDNPSSVSLRQYQANLEQRADGHGLVVTEKGIFINNK